MHIFKPILAPDQQGFKVCGSAYLICARTVYILRQCLAECQYTCSRQREVTQINGNDLSSLLLQNILNMQQQSATSAE